MSRSIGLIEDIEILTNQQGNPIVPYHLSVNINVTLQYINQLISKLTFYLKRILKKEIEISDLAMVDTVHYYNEKIGPKQVPEISFHTDEVNCVPHFNPGLFSLNQRENKWIDGSDNSQLDQASLGIIWLGEAASILSNNQYKAGIHRVIDPLNQIKPFISAHNLDEYLSAVTVVKLDNQPDPKQIQVLSGGETRIKFTKRIEHDWGLSFSRSLPTHIREIHPSFSMNNTFQSPSVQINQTKIVKKKK
ncbi:hypothetical protein I4U23_021035 [Adineta vaga]|nr:hypothetical protein I4U23_021035 [Adineta vaga]